MKKYTFLLITVFSVLFTNAQSKKQIPLSSEDDNYSVLNQSKNGFTFQLNLGQLEAKEVANNLGNFISISNKQLNQVYTAGLPNIPIFSRLIEVPQGATVEFVVKSFDERTIKLADFNWSDKIVPAANSLSKSETEIVYQLNKSVYQSNSFFNTEIARFVESGQMRSMRIGRIEVAPIQYNPVTNELKILNNLVIEVKFSNANHEKTESTKSKYGKLMNQSSNQGFLNQLEYDTKELIQQAPAHLVIVSHRMFEAQLQPYIAWKVKKGFKVTVGYTDVVGTTKEEIKAFLLGIYQGTDPMSFVLLVGDVAQIPAWTGVSDTSHVTDLYYADFTNDHLPDVYYGRFSAQNTSQLQPQIDKTLMYEQYTMPDPSYLANSLLVVGDDSGHEMTWGNGQMWYAENYYFKASNNLNNTTYYQPADNGAVHTQIINRVNAGLSFSNYSAHCSADGWASPSFSMSDVNGLTNANKYGLLIGNCCSSSTFNSDCFAEAILRKANGGAMGYIGASNSSYWDEDYWWGVGLTSSIVAQPTYEASGRGAYDGYWHQLANEVNDTNTWYLTQSQMIVGGNLAVEASTSSIILYYWEIYHLMGDPSVLPYIGMPQAMSVVASPAALMIGMTSLQVTSAPYAYVALSQNGVLVATALSNETGLATLNFDGAALSVGNADLVVSAQNRVPYIGNITVSPADQPYVVLNNFVTVPEADYGQSVSINVTLENVAGSGSGYDANEVVAEIASTDTFVTITDNTQGFGNIVAGSTASESQAYTFSIANNVPDEHVAVFNMTISDNAGNSWNAVMNITLNAPEFSVLGLSINDSSGDNDGILDPGETADITIQTQNTGHADVASVLGNIVSSSSFLTINTATDGPLTIDENAIADFIFNVTADNDTPLGTPADIVFNVSGGDDDQYTGNKDFQIIIGFVPTYCDAGADNTNDEFIQNVTFNTINNTSTQGPDYSDYTDISTSINRGESYPITVVNGEHWSSDIIGCWIDWNYDGDFTDTNEQINMTYTDQDPIGVGNGTVVVPNNAFLGNLRMRVRVQFGGTLSSCGNTSYGEVEDYTVVVMPALVVEEFEHAVGIYPNPTNGTFTVNINDTFINESVYLDIYNALGQTVYSSRLSSKQEQVNIEKEQGIYYARFSSGNNIVIKKLLIQ